MESITIEVSPPGEFEPDTLALPFSSDDSEVPSNGARQLEGGIGARLRRLAAGGELKGELGKTVLLHGDEGSGLRRVVVAGVGKRADVDADAVRTAASAVVRGIGDAGGSVAWLLDDSLPLPLAEQARAIVEGTVLGASSPGRWKTEEQPDRSVEKIVLWTEDAAVVG
jgi:leucyl aminopeptidase